MKLRLSTVLISLALPYSLLAQAPDGWTRTKEKTTIKVKGEKISKYGEWANKDEIRTAIVVNVGQAKTVKDLSERGAGMISGVLRSRVLPLKFESHREPHPMLIVRGQVEYKGGEYFQDTYAVLTQKGLLMIKVSGLETGVPFEVKKWDLGEPIKDDGSFADQMEKLAKDSNENLPKLQGLVKKAREARKKQ